MESLVVYSSMGFLLVCLVILAMDISNVRMKLTHEATESKLWMDRLSHSVRELENTIHNKDSGLLVRSEVASNSIKMLAAASEQKPKVKKAVRKR